MMLWSTKPAGVSTAVSHGEYECSKTKCLHRQVKPLGEQASHQFQAIGFSSAVFSSELICRQSLVHLHHHSAQTHKKINLVTFSQVLLHPLLDFCNVQFPY